MLSDQAGATSYILDFCLGGTSYVSDNFIYKAAVTDPNANESLMIYRDVYDNTPLDPEYGPPLEDLHFTHNFVVDNNPSGSNSFVALSCAASSTASCPAPANGPVLTTPAVIKDNLFIGIPAQVTNQPDAILQNNTILPITALDRLKLPALK